MKQFFEEPVIRVAQFAVTDQTLFLSSISLFDDETNPYGVPAITQE